MQTTGVRSRDFTYHDYRLLPETGPHYQLIRGDLIMSPAPNRYHQEILSNIFLVLGPWVSENNLGKVYVAPFDVQLTETDVFQPDLAYFSEARMAFLTDAGAEGPPTLVVEILSPKTARIDRTVKREIYARTGVEELWLVDPQKKWLQVYRLQEDATAPMQTLSPGGTFASVLFEGLEIDVDAVFED